jgi:hypothetical protein
MTGSLAEVAAEPLPWLGVTDIAPAEVASAIVIYWYGMELQPSLQITKDEGRLWQTVEMLRRLIERLETGKRQIRPAKPGQEET